MSSIISLQSSGGGTSNMISQVTDCKYRNNHPQLVLKKATRNPNGENKVDKNAKGT